MEHRRTQRTGASSESTIGPQSFERVGASEPVAPASPTVDLHVCPACGCALVYPLDWEPVGHRAWRVSLRCPGCEWRGGGEYEKDVVDSFDDALDDGTAQLLDDLCLLTRANMEEDIERLIGALHAGAILPEDF